MAICLVRFATVHMRCEFWCPLNHVYCIFGLRQIFGVPLWLHFFATLSLHSISKNVSHLLHFGYTLSTSLFTTLLLHFDYQKCATFATLLTTLLYAVLVHFYYTFDYTFTTFLTTFDYTFGTLSVTLQPPLCLLHFVYTLITKNAPQMLHFATLWSTSLFTILCLHFCYTLATTLFTTLWLPKMCHICYPQYLLYLFLHSSHHIVYYTLFTLSLHF